MLRAGIEIRLDPGWKTYWRYPGDSGVPPTLDFAGSENVKSVTALWPAPQRFADGAGGHSIGYLAMSCCRCGSSPKDATKARVAARQARLRRLRQALRTGGSRPRPRVVRQSRRRGAGAGRRGSARAAARAARRSPALAAVLPSARCIARRPERSSASSSRSPRRKVRRSIFSSKDRRPNGRCRYPSRERPAPDGAPGMRRFTFDLDGLPPGARRRRRDFDFHRGFAR